MESDKKRIPTLKGFLTKDSKQIRVWCPFCNKFHIHSAEDGHPAMKHHRVAHCFVDSSPLKQTGYYIKPFSKGDLSDND